MTSRAPGGEPSSRMRAPEAPRADEPLESTVPHDPTQPGDRDSEEYIIDLIPDDLALARTQLASGLAGLSEAVMLRRIARLETQARGAPEELDAARALLAEALWRQGRPLAAGEAIDRCAAGASSVAGP